MDGTRQTLVTESPLFYEIDFEKLNTVEDIKDLFKALDIIFPSGHKRLSQIKHLLKELE